MVQEVNDTPPNNVFSTIYGEGEGQFHYVEGGLPHVIMNTGPSDLPDLKYRWLMLYSCYSSIYYGDSFANHGSVFLTSEGAPVDNESVRVFVQAIIEGNDEGELYGMLLEEEPDAGFEAFQGDE